MFLPICADFVPFFASFRLLADFTQGNAQLRAGEFTLNLSLIHTHTYILEKTGLLRSLMSGLVHRALNCRMRQVPETDVRPLAPQMKFKAFSSKRGLFFHTHTHSALPNYTRTPGPLPTRGGLLKIPVGGLPKEGGGGGRGRGGGVCGEFGERARPLYREKKAPFR